MKELEKDNKKISNRSQKLQKIDRFGRIYIPSFIRTLFRDYRFFVVVESGKIVLDPVKIDDDFNGGQG